MLINDLYDVACKTPSDINYHLPDLRSLANFCEHVTEFGTRTGVSTTALLAGRPKKLVCYDIERLPEVDTLEKTAKECGVEFQFHQRSTVDPETKIEPTDFLFIDTLHTYRQLSYELMLHAKHVRRFIGFHDVCTFGLADEVGDDGSRQLGLMPAILEFMCSCMWFRIRHYSRENNGLLILERA